MVSRQGIGGLSGDVMDQKNNKICQNQKLKIKVETLTACRWIVVNVLE